MVTYPLAWCNISTDTPENFNDVLVLTRQGYVAIAAPFPDVDWEYTKLCTWHIKIGIDTYEEWDEDKYGEIAYWAEIVWDSHMLKPYR